MINFWQYIRKIGFISATSYKFGHSKLGVFIRIRCIYSPLGCFTLVLYLGSRKNHLYNPQTFLWIFRISDTQRQNLLRKLAGRHLFIRISHTDFKDQELEVKPISTPSPPLSMLIHTLKSEIQAIKRVGQHWKEGEGGFGAIVDYFGPKPRTFLNSFGVGCLNLAWCRIFTFAHRMDLILSHIWHMAQRSIAKKFGKVFTSWRHLMTSSKFLGPDRFWPYMAIWQVMILWSIDFCLEWCSMLHFLPKRLSYLSRSIDRRFVKFQCIDIRWWRHSSQNWPNLRIFTRSDHLPYLWF